MQEVVEVEVSVKGACHSRGMGQGSPGWDSGQSFLELIVAAFNHAVTSRDVTSQITSGERECGAFFFGVTGFESAQGMERSLVFCRVVGFSGGKCH